MGQRNGSSRQYSVYCVAIVSLFLSIDGISSYLGAGNDRRLLRIALDSGCHAALAGLVWYASTELLPSEHTAPTGYASPWRPCGNVQAVVPFIVRYSEVLWSLFCGSAVDIDHFIAAGSLTIEGATHLASRPWGHCVLTAVLVALLAGGVPSLLTYARRFDMYRCIEIRLSFSGQHSAWNDGRRMSLLVFIAYIVHLLRDSVRRGLWIVSYLAYVFEAVDPSGSSVPTFVPLTTPPLPVWFVLGLYCALPLAIRAALTSLEASAAALAGREEPAMAVGAKFEV